MKRKMPTKESILDYWRDKLWDLPKDVIQCWGCGFEANVERCHIKSRFDGGSDTPENLILLCPLCHHAQEAHCLTENGRNDFMQKLMDGAPYMYAKIKYYQAILE